jgi:predicted HAD superfamily phosphohydrolase YqeG
MVIKQKNIFFHDLETSDINNSTIILDIDGTLTCSSKMKIEQRVIDKIRELQKTNFVYVFSNNYNGKRSREIAKSINLPYIESPYKKPNKKVLHYIENEICDVIAIGDKYLTDGLFAQFINAQHIRVKRYQCKKDSVADKIACFFDDIIYTIARLVCIVR